MTTVTIEQLRDWLATQCYDVDEHMGEPYTTGWSHAVTHLIAELPRYWERIARGEYSVGHCTEQRSSLGDSQNHAPGNVGPNQAGADGNGADGQTFSPASSMEDNDMFSARAWYEAERETLRLLLSCPNLSLLERVGFEHRLKETEEWLTQRCAALTIRDNRVDAGLSELRDANAQRRDPVRLEWEDVE